MCVERVSQAWACALHVTGKETPPRLIAEGSEAVCCHRHYRPTGRRHYHCDPYRHQSRCLPRVAGEVGGAGHNGVYEGNIALPLCHPSLPHFLPIRQTQTRRTQLTAAEPEKGEPIFSHCGMAYSPYSAILQAFSPFSKTDFNLAAGFYSCRN